MSEDATKAEAPIHAAWTPEGEVKPPAAPVSEDAVIGAISTVSGNSSGYLSTWPDLRD